MPSKPFTLLDFSVSATFYLEGLFWSAVGVLELSNYHFELSRL